MGKNEFNEWFKTHGEYNLHSTYYECGQHFTVEELYQAFKARFIAEIPTVDEHSDMVCLDERCQFCMRPLEAGERCYCWNDE